jgi:methyl-accepting chemotaxis protein
VLRSIIRPLSIVMTDLAERSVEIGQASGQLSTSSQNLARGASRQAAALEQTHATLV